MLIREKIKTEDLIYAACSLDCEGSITVSHNITRQGWLSMHVVVSIANTNTKLTNFLLETFGGRIQVEAPKKLSKRVIYRWKISSQQAAGFLSLVLPYMKLKQVQAMLAIEFHSKSRRFDSKESREAFWHQMKALNRGESLAETKRMDVGTNPRSDSPILEEILAESAKAMASLSASQTLPN